jgi:hypothetical protein
MRQESKFIRYSYIVQSDHWTLLINPSSFPRLYVVLEVLLIFTYRLVGPVIALPDPH